MEKKKLKIAFLSRYQDEVSRGAETYVLELSKRLRQSYEVYILKGKDADSFQKMVQGGYDLIIPVNGRVQSLKAGLGRIWSRYKLVISGQAGIGKDDIWNILFASPDVYVAITDFESNWAQQWALAAKVVKIPNGVDLEKFSSSGSKIDLRLKGKVVLSVGALFWYKHHELSIKAAARMSDANLLIIGNGPEESSLRSLGNKLLGDRFKILKVDYDQIPKYYRSADVFVLPSWDRESFGIVYLEAMASGIPVVAPNDLPRKEIIGEAGILVDVEDSEKYANAIKQALDKDWDNVPRRQAEKFSWDEVAEQYIFLIEQMFKR